MPSSPLLDLTRAQEFAFEEAQLRELVATFEQSLVQEMAVIHASLAAGDAQRVEHALHALKGFMPLFAAPELAQTMAEVYQTSREQPVHVTRSAITALVPNLEGLLAEVRAWLHPL